MPELDDAALERRLRGVLKEHLGALPLDLTVDALDRRREAKGRCPTIRPGPRHDAARGGSPVARRRGVGGGLRLPAAAVRRPACACPIGRCGRHGIARCDVPEPERVGSTIRKSRLDRLRGSAWRPERADRPTGLDPGESEGGLARAGPPRARWRRERPTDAPHLPRSHGRQRIYCLPLRRHPLGDGRHQRGAPQARLETAAGRGSHRAVDRVWRRDR